MSNPSATESPGDQLPADEAAYHAVMAYTLSLGDPAFIHQHVVDAWGAQQAQPGGSPIRVFFSVVGLYLLAEHGFSGRAVQVVHMRLANTPGGAGRREWPTAPLPAARGALGAHDVLAAPPGEARDAVIRRWAVVVWEAYAPMWRPVVAPYLRARGVVR
jgi:hypothetical protein